MLSLVAAMGRFVVIKGGRGSRVRWRAPGDALGTGWGRVPGVLRSGRRQLVLGLLMELRLGWGWLAFVRCKGPGWWVVFLVGLEWSVCQTGRQERCRPKKRPVGAPCQLIGSTSGCDCRDLLLYETFVEPLDGGEEYGIWKMLS